MPYLPKTSWTLIKNACGHGPLSEAAMEEFLRRYLPPVNAYITALIGNKQEAEDLAQSFFTEKILMGNLLVYANVERGMFRPYLKGAIKKHIYSENRSMHCKKRQALEMVWPDAGGINDWENLGIAVQTAADMAFHQAWVRSLLKGAMKKLSEDYLQCEEKDECKLCEKYKQCRGGKKEQMVNFKIFIDRYLSDATKIPSWEEIGATYGLDGKTARSRTDAVKGRFVKILRRILMDELGSEKLVDEEIAAMLAFI